MTGCASTADMTSALDDVFTSDMEKTVIRTNNYGTYIDYYLPSDTQEYACDDMSCTFVFNRSKIIMDVNISGIINMKYYPSRKITDEGFFDDDTLVYTHSGTCLKSDDEQVNYFYNLYRLNDDYLGYFVSDELIFYAYTNIADVIPVTSRILLMAKGVNVNSNDIVARYSSKDVIDYQKKQINLFETNMPVNGVVNDFMIDPVVPESNNE